MNKMEFENISAFHPGYYIRDLINEMEMTQDEFAKRLNITPKNLSDLINGKASISDNIAKNLSLMLGTTVDIWLDLQKKYDQKVIEINILKSQREEEADLALLDYSFFENLGVVKDTKDKVQQISELLKYLAVSSLSVLKKPDLLVQYRQVKNVDEKVILNSNAWVQTVINMGKQIETQPYCGKKLKGYLPQIRKMTLQTPSEFLPYLFQILSEAGVAFVLIPSLKNSGVYGATKWINRDKVVLGITNRGKNADIFWFSLLHELAHVLQKKITKTLIDSEEDVYTEDYEKEADRFARDVLIDPKDYKLFIAEGIFNEQKIQEFANSINVQPGIVVGRLQKEGFLPYTHLNKLKLKYVFKN